MLLILKIQAVLVSDMLYVIFGVIDNWIWWICVLLWGHNHLRLDGKEGWIDTISFIAKNTFENR